MKPYRLLTKDEQPKLPPCIEVLNSKKEVIAKIWADRTITTAEKQMDYDYEEVKYFLYIAKNFYTLFNNLRDKDKEIERLRNEINCELYPTLKQ